VPVGNADGGQWTNGDSRTRAPADADPDADVHITLAGGFTKDQLNLTVDDFVAQNCTGSVRRELPGQFYGSTVGEVMATARSGDAAARKCLKILREDRFRK
jgi:hypothetical protein